MGARRTGRRRPDLVTRSTPPADTTPAPTRADGPEPDRLAYSVDEAARLTGLSRDLLYDQMRRGNLPYIKVGRRRVITRQHLERFLDIAPTSAAHQPGQARS